MANHYRPEVYTNNRIGDWIDNSALRELRRDEDALLGEKEINVQKLLENHKKQERIYREGISQLILAMDTQKKELELKFADELERREKEIKRIKAQIVELVHKNEALSERAQELVLELNKINQQRMHSARIADQYHQLAVSKYQEIVSNVTCVKFSKEKIDRLNDMIYRLNSPELSPEVRQAIAITVLSDINEVIHRSEREYGKFITKYELLVKHITDFIFSLNETFFLDDDENTTLDIDHWTNNAFIELMANAETLKSHIDSGVNAIDYQIPQIREDEDYLKHLIEQRDELIAQAKLKAIRSHQVIETGKILQNTLVINEKFSPHSFQFEFNDDRGILVVELVRNVDKKKLTFLFFQDSKTPFSPLCIVRQGSYVNASAYKEFCDGIKKLLRNVGIFISFSDANQNCPLYEEETFTPDNGQICNNIRSLYEATFNKYLI